MNILKRLRIRHPADIAAYIVAGALIYILTAVNPQVTGANLVGGVVNSASAHAQSISVYGSAQ